MKLSLGNLKVGMTIYHVHAFQDNRRFKNTWLEDYEVLKFPVTTSHGNDNFVDLKRGDLNIKANFDTNNWEHTKSYNTGHTKQKSMQDMGIISNNYNNHQTFNSLADAKQYICNFNQVNFTEPSSNYDRAMGVLDI